MATRTYNFKDAVPTGATLHRSLQLAGSVTAATTGTGWVASDKAVGQSCLMNGGSIIARSDGQWSASLQPDTAGAPSQSLGDCWRIENAITGTFAESANWTGSIGFRAVTANYTGRFRIRYRFWKSKDPNGANAVALTAVLVTAASTADVATSADTTFNIGWTQTSNTFYTFDGEYLFIQMGIEITTQGTGTTPDLAFRVTDGTYKVDTSNFVERGRIGRNKTQPRAALGINPRWRDRGVRFAWLASIPYIDQGPNRLRSASTPPTGHTVVGSKHGRGIDFGSVSTSGFTFIPTTLAKQPITNAADFSIAALAAPSRSLSTRCIAYSQRLGSGSFEQVDFCFRANGALVAESRCYEIFMRNTAGSNFSADNAVTFDNGSDGTIHLYGCQNNNGTLDILRDGIIRTEQRTGGSPSGTFALATQQVRVGNLGDYATDGTYAGNGVPIFMVLVFQPHLELSAWAELASDPYDVFADTDDIYAIMAAGGFHSREYYDRFIGMAA